jgi:RecJ-like exonuclease
MVLTRRKQMPETAMIGILGITKLARKCPHCGRLNLPVQVDVRDRGRLDFNFFCNFVEAPCRGCNGSGKVAGTVEAIEDCSDCAGSGKEYCGHYYTLHKSDSYRLQDEEEIQCSRKRL